MGWDKGLDSSQCNREACLSISAGGGHGDENTPTHGALTLHLNFLNGSISKHFQYRQTLCCSIQSSLH